VRKSLTPDLESKRIIGRGMNGGFIIQGPTGAALHITVSDGTQDGDGYERISVWCRHRDPTWREMCFVKDLFFDDEETVIQLHAAKSKWSNDHPHVLHLWRHPDHDVPLPPPPELAPC
jgi:hypothetical protein